MHRYEQRMLRNLKQKIKYKPFILLALARDKNRCTDCGEDGKQLIVHHLDESRKTGKLNNNLSNLITLCKPCHARRHSLTSDREDVVELREAGLTYEEIGERLGFTRQRAHQLYQKHFKHFAT